MSQFVRYVASNQVRSLRRRRMRSIEQEQLESAEVATKPEPPMPKLNEHGELPQDQTAFDDEVMQALQSLGEVARACILLRTIEGLSYAEISQILAIPEGTAMSHVHRSRKALRHALMTLTGSLTGTDGRPV